MKSNRLGPAVQPKSVAVLTVTRKSDQEDAEQHDRDHRRDRECRSERLVDFLSYNADQHIANELSESAQHTMQCLGASTDIDARTPVQVDLTRDEVTTDAQSIEA